MFSKKHFEYITEYFQSISITNQLLQKSFIFVPPKRGNASKIFASLDQIFRK